MTKEVNFWILTGDIANWRKGLEDRIWGVREGNLKQFWQKLSQNDVLLFYVKAPIKGLIGFGKCGAKFKQDKPLWPDEIAENKLIYPYRWEFKVIYSLPAHEWKNKKINIADLSINTRAGLSSVKSKEAIEKACERVHESWKINIITEPISQSMEKVTEQKTENLHSKIQNLLLKLGELKTYIVEKEVTLDGQRLDVTWKRLERSVPSHCFEVQVGGDVQHALGKLKHAFDLWNSQLYLIADAKHMSQIETYLSGTFHEIKEQIHVITYDEIDKFYNLMLESEKIREKFGLP